MITYTDLKKLIYAAETLAGMFLLGMAWWLLCPPGINPISTMVGIILGITGFVCILFGITTFIIRNDPDVWR